MTHTTVHQSQYLLTSTNSEGKEDKSRARLQYFFCHSQNPFSSIFPSILCKTFTFVLSICREAHGSATTK